MRIFVENRKQDSLVFPTSSPSADSQLVVGVNNQPRRRDESVPSPRSTGVAEEDSAGDVGRGGGELSSSPWFGANDDDEAQ